jgi:multisubunit Na+/H+ antiporter MnhB subunit
MAVTHVGEPKRSRAPTALNGVTLAAILAAGIGGFAMGLFVILHEAGVFSAPSLYAPAGALSGRSTFAVVVWLVAWGVLHARWNRQEVAAVPVFRLTLALVALGVLGTFPPVWGLFE